MLEISGIGVLTAFAAGMISFLSPCVLPLVPAYISYITGKSIGDVDATQPLMPMLWTSVLFVAGFSLVFVTLGAGASAVGRLLLTYKNEATIVGGVIVLIFGLFMVGVLRLPFLGRDLRFQGIINRGSPYAAFGLGLAFAFGWTPCIGPVLGAILTVSTVSPEVGSGVVLLAIYSLGLGVPFIAAALFTGAFVSRMRTMRKFGMPLQIGAGIILILMGIAMITGYLTTFSYWLLRNFPVFSQIG
ncbi:MAG: cytochrome c biogenesis protein CcdA [Gammaproteobacteria bacterium]|nr:cytochrome c biogenesis protein CcdA [Gammaproteobacteria bacterium]MDH3412973.1 cytochrome c biogenesis protein CcdA [Gammaproteobacteria bacterium]